MAAGMWRASAFVCGTSGMGERIPCVPSPTCYGESVKESLTAAKQSVETTRGRAGAAH